MMAAENRLGGGGGGGGDGRLLHLQGSEPGDVSESAYGSEEKWMDFK